MQEHRGWLRMECCVELLWTVACRLSTELNFFLHFYVKSLVIVKKNRLILHKVFNQNNLNGFSLTLLKLL